MSEPASPAAPQRNLLSFGAVALLLCAAAAWALYSRFGYSPTARAGTPLLKVKAKGPTDLLHHPLRSGAEISPQDALKWTVTLDTTAYVYFFNEYPNGLSLLFGHEKTEAPWQPGEYEPEGYDEPDGVRFDVPGPFRLVVVASPKPLESQPELWTSLAPEALARHCPGCSSYAVDLIVK